MSAIRVRFERVLASATQPEFPSHVRGLSTLCAVLALLTAYLTVFPVVSDPLIARNIGAAAILAAAAVVLWVFAPRFKVWMLHLAMVVVIVGLFARLVVLDSLVTVAITLSVLTWACVLVGGIYAPAVARTYCALIVVGSGVVVGFGHSEVDVGVWLAFALGYVIVTEILTRMGTRLRTDAVTDPLTGLLNRKGMLGAGAIAAAIATRANSPLSVVQIDLDDFKGINDRSGHEDGDRTLAACAAAWSSQVRAGDVLARPGGDEFTLILPCSDLSAAEEAIARLRAVSEVSWSAGVAELRPGESLVECMARADQELTAVKASGRRRTVPDRPRPAAVPQSE